MARGLDGQKLRYEKYAETDVNCLYVAIKNEIDHEIPNILTISVFVNKFVFQLQKRNGRLNIISAFPSQRNSYRKTLKTLVLETPFLVGMPHLIWTNFSLAKNSNGRKNALSVLLF